MPVNAERKEIIGEGRGSFGLCTHSRPGYPKQPQKRQDTNEIWRNNVRWRSAAARATYRDATGPVHAITLHENRRKASTFGKLKAQPDEAGNKE